MNVVLISTYELGHQPFGLASPAAWLKAAGASVTCLDLAVQPLARAAIASADLVAIYLPMHTATRLAVSVIEQVQEINPSVRICCYGLYAPMNEHFLHGLGVETILGGEFEAGLVALYRRLSDTQRVPGGPLSVAGNNGQRTQQPEPLISLAKQTFLPPDRSGLPELSAYAFVQLGDGTRLTAGYTEASRGCKHLCRHCPIVPVYGGVFRVVQREVVIEDIRRQVAAGARHITFGDPDFFNGPGHALRLVEALHAEFAGLTYDVTIKVEHLLRYARYLPTLRATGCLFVTSAVEAVDDAILARFDKRHTRADFIRAVELLREIGLALNPTFVAFTPWTSPDGYIEFLKLIWELELVEHLSPIQYAIRLLIPAGSRLLELPEVRELVGPFDQAALCYPWPHPNPSIDQLHADVLRAVKGGQAGRATRESIFGAVWELAEATRAATAGGRMFDLERRKRTAQAPIPHLSEPWYC